ncbi:MAG TPA: cupredoxin domain-containing protein [Actinomycetota bacterium]|nr:cupredoxin domain-containing protein [Actinomycetota bacterium]
MTRRAWRIGAAVAVVSVLLSACAQQPATDQAQDIHGLYYLILALALFVVVVVYAGLVWALVRYRRRKDDDGSEPPQWYGSTRTLVLFFLFGTIIVVALFPFGEVALSRVDENPSPIEVIDVQGSQWQWSAFYPNEGVVTSGKSACSPAAQTCAGSGHPMVIEVPIDTTVQIHLISTDVMHEFFVSNFFFMRNALPGHPNTFTWTPNTLGTFQGQCAEFCGLGHYQMRFVVRVVSETDFLAWVKQERQSILQITCPLATSNGLQITAHDISWNTNCFHVQPGQTIPITVQNLDAGINHNFAIWDGIDTKHQFFATGKFPGVATKTFTIPQLQAGKYYFQCNVHGPAMSGVFIVGGSSKGGG